MRNISWLQIASDVPYLASLLFLMSLPAALPQIHIV